jgi:hypothetical protein
MLSLVYYLFRKYMDLHNQLIWTAMAQNGLSVDGNASDECKTIAAQAISGLGEIAPMHFFYNYQYYFEALPENSQILVIRSEHL